MSAVHLSILGAGSVRCSVPVMACLATYFGERPLEITLYDSDEERLDLVDRYARLCFLTTKSTHGLKSTVDYREALEGADKVVVQIGENCARKFLKENRRQGFADLVPASLIEQAVDDLLRDIPFTVPVLSLIDVPIAYPRDVYQCEGWPPELSEMEEGVLPHQILRWIRSDEYPYQILDANEHAPLRAWLEDPSTLPLLQV